MKISTITTYFYLVVFCLVASAVTFGSLSGSDAVERLPGIVIGICLITTAINFFMLLGFLVWLVDTTGNACKQTRASLQEKAKQAAFDHKVRAYAKISGLPEAEARDELTEPHNLN